MWNRRFYTQSPFNERALQYSLKLSLSLAVLVLVFLIPSRLTEIRNYISPEQIDHIVDQIPSFQIQSSELKTAENIPYVIKDRQGDNLAYIDININKDQALDLLNSSEYQVVFTKNFYIINGTFEPLSYPSNLNYSYNLFSDRQKLQNDLSAMLKSGFNNRTLAVANIFVFGLLFLRIFFNQNLAAFFLTIIIFLIFRYYSSPILSVQKESQVPFFYTIFRGCCVAVTLPIFLSSLALCFYFQAPFLSSTLGYLAQFTYIISFYFAYIYAHARSQDILNQPRH